MIFQTACAHLGSLEKLEEDKTVTFLTCEPNDDFLWLFKIDISIIYDIYYILVKFHLNH